MSRGSARYWVASRSDCGVRHLLRRGSMARARKRPRRGGGTVFGIRPSTAATGGSLAVRVPTDRGLCADCRGELLDRADRRFLHPFITCTDCGPRYSIVRALPYDRPDTTMAGLSPVRECAREYVDPGCRRFHAQPIACLSCGPRLASWDASGRPGGQRGRWCWARLRRCWWRAGSWP